MKLSVSDVIFVLDKKTQAVVPCQLVEIVSSVTLEGEDIKHIASTPGGKKFNLDEYESLWFSTYEEAKEYLTNAALELVSSTMKRAEQVAIKTFNYKPSSSEESKFQTPSEDVKDGDIPHQETLPEETFTDNEQVFVDIGGQQVKVTLPKELINE